MPDHGILEGAFLPLCALSFQPGISYLGILSSRLQKITQGKAGMLVKDGVLQLAAMKEFRISRHQVFAQLPSGSAFWKIPLPSSMGDGR